MTTTTAAAMTARTAGRLRSWLAVRHSLRSEAAAVLVVYGLYELARGLVVGETAEADRHARQIVALERSPHLFVEANVQHAARALPGLTSLVGIAYLTLHLAVTAAMLLWLHVAPPRSHSFAPHFCSQADSPSSVSSSTRRRRRVWPGSASPTPSRTATSTSTRVSLARPTSPTPPSPACTSATL